MSKFSLILEKSLKFIKKDAVSQHTATFPADVPQADRPKGHITYSDTFFLTLFHFPGNKFRYLQWTVNRKILYHIFVPLRSNFACK